MKTMTGSHLYKSLYFLRLGDAVKIGYTKDLKQRMVMFQTSYPNPIELMLVLEGDRLEEKRLHKEFAHFKIRGEWFDLDGDLKSYIKEKQATKSFKEFLSVHRQLNNTDGDFRQDCLLDDTFPQVNNWSELYRYLRLNNACQEAINAARRWWGRYAKYRRLHDQREIS